MHFNHSLCLITFSSSTFHLQGCLHTHTHAHATIITHLYAERTPQITEWWIHTSPLDRLSVYLPLTGSKLYILLRRLAASVKMSVLNSNIRGEAKEAAMFFTFGNTVM